MMSDLDFYCKSAFYIAQVSNPIIEIRFSQFLFSKFPICYKPQNAKSGSSDDDDIRKELSLVDDNGPATKSPRRA